MTAALAGSRRQLIEFRAVSTRSQVWAASRSMALWVVCFGVAIAADPLPLRIAAAIGAGLLATTLFLTGHDCGHGSFTGRPVIDRRLGRAVMLASYQPASIWSSRHNGAHHRWPNVRGRDFVWVPFDLAEYRSRGPLGRLRLRLERTTPGMALYYVREIWWNQQIRAVAGGRLTPRQRADRLLAIGWLFGSAALAAGVASRLASGTWLDPGPAAVAVVLAVVLPFVITMWLQAFGTYYNHTDREIAWFDDVESWQAAGGQTATSLHLTFPRPLAWILGNVFEHPAHHLDPKVPLCHLEQAQDAVTDAAPAAIVARRWSFDHHRRTMRACRLYDYERHAWIDFDGRITSTTPLHEKQPAVPA